MPWKNKIERNRTRMKNVYMIEREQIERERELETERERERERK